METKLIIDCGVALTRAAIIREDRVYAIGFGPALGDEDVQFSATVGQRYYGRILKTDKVTKTAFIDIGTRENVFVRMGRASMPIEGGLYEVEVLKAARGVKKATVKIIREVTLSSRENDGQDIQKGPVEIIENSIAQIYKTLIHDREIEIHEVIISNGKAKILVQDLLSRFELDVPVTIDDVAFNDIEEIHSLTNLLSPQVLLEKGGVLTIEEGEAVTAIDVDMGSMTGSEGISRDKLIENLNKAAAQTILDHIILRRLGGQIVVDFLPMRKPNRQRFDGWLHEVFKPLTGFTRAGWTKSDLFCFVLPRPYPSLLESVTQCGKDDPVAGRIFRAQSWLQFELCRLEMRMRQSPSLFFDFTLSSQLYEIFDANPIWKKRLDETYGGRLKVLQQSNFSRLETRIDERR